MASVVRGSPGMALKVQRALEYAYDNVEQAATYLMEGREQCEQLSDPPSRHLRVDTWEVSQRSEIWAIFQEPFKEF